VFLRAQEERRGQAEKASGSKTRVFFHEIGQMLKNHWRLSIYAVLLMAGFNFLSHGSQDLYPTYLQASKGFSKFDATVATIIGNCGAIAYVAIISIFERSLTIWFDAVGVQSPDH
jgi:SHS family lactate transporter-like MFS transporter